jgi:hypothetical protein
MKTSPHKLSDARLNGVVSLKTGKVIETNYCSVIEGQLGCQAKFSCEGIQARLLEPAPSGTAFLLTTKRCFAIHCRLERKFLPLSLGNAALPWWPVLK